LPGDLLLVVVSWWVWQPLATIGAVGGGEGEKTSQFSQLFFDRKIALFFLGKLLLFL
jgi:hypothetical protein